MSVALLLITHEKIATGMLEIAASIINDRVNNLAYVEVPMDNPIEKIESEINAKLRQLDTESGLIILTDIYGSTPCNIANSYAQRANTKLICGLNLPMLIKIFNYRELGLEELAEKAVSGGEQGIRLNEGTQQ